MGCHSLLQEIFPTQGLNPGLPHCRQTLHHLSHVSAIYQHESAISIHMFLPLEPPSHLPPHPTSLGCHRALSLSSLSLTTNSHWLSISHMVMDMFQCNSFNSSLFPLPQVCPLRLCCHCYSANRQISIIFLDFIYMC